MLPFSQSCRRLRGDALDSFAAFHGATMLAFGTHGLYESKGWAGSQIHEAAALSQSVREFTGNKLWCAALGNDRALDQEVPADFHRTVAAT